MSMTTEQNRTNLNRIARRIVRTVRQRYPRGAMRIFYGGESDGHELFTFGVDTEAAIIAALQACDYSEVRVIDRSRVFGQRVQGTLCVAWDFGQTGVCETLANYTSDCVVAETLLDNCNCPHCR